MNSIIKKFIYSLIFTFAVSPVAMATTVSVITSNLLGDAPYTQTGKLGNKVGNDLGYYDAKWGSSATAVWTTFDANSDIANQGIGNTGVTDWIRDTTGYEGNLTLVSNVDALGSGTTGAFNFGNNLVNYLAVHYGQGESLFYFANGVSQFDLSFIEGNFGLSNYRAYGDDTPSAVPVPAAVWLLGSVLFGFAAFSKRRKI